MNKKHFLFPTILIFCVTSLIIFLIPLEIKNTTALVIGYITYCLYNFISIFIILKNIDDSLQENISGLAIFYIFGLYDLVFIIEVLLNKFIYINTNIASIIVLLTLVTYILVMYFLIYAKKYINNKPKEVKQKTKNTDDWIADVEIIINNLGDNENKEELDNLYETLKYMDPVSDDSVLELDQKITSEIKNLKKNLTKENISKIMMLLNERKVFVKNSK